KIQNPKSKIQNRNNLAVPAGVAPANAISTGWERHSLPSEPNRSPFNLEAAVGVSPTSFRSAGGCLNVRPRGHAYFILGCSTGIEPVLRASQARVLPSHSEHRVSILGRTRRNRTSTCCVSGSHADHYIIVRHQDGRI